MKHKTIIFALLGVLIAIFMLVRYGLFIVYWLTTPNALERTEAEKQLIEHFKEVFKTNEIVISPEYDLEKDTTYTVYVQNIPCADTLSSKEKTIYIKNKLDSIALKPRFKHYIIHLGLNVILIPIISMNTKEITENEIKYSPCWNIFCNSFAIKKYIKLYEKSSIHHFRQVRQLGTGLSFCCPW